MSRGSKRGGNSGNPRGFSSVEGVRFREAVVLRAVSVGSELPVTGDMQPAVRLLWGS